MPKLHVSKDVSIDTTEDEAQAIKETEEKEYIKLQKKSANPSRQVAQQKALEKHTRRFIFFKARGSFHGSKPAKNSPYQTASPFYSNVIMGRVIFPPGTQLENLHKALSRALNDRHVITGKIGDWRETHSPKFKGFWSFKFEEAIEIRVGLTKRYIVQQSISESEGE